MKQAIYRRLLEHIAQTAYEKQRYWMTIGAGGHSPALVDQHGNIEPSPWSGALYPLLTLEGEPDEMTFVSRELLEGYLPIPTVRFKAQSGVMLEISALVARPGGEQPYLLVRYRVKNDTGQPRSGTLHVLYTPYKVNPPLQKQADPHRAPAGRLEFKRLLKSRNRRYFYSVCDSAEGERRTRILPLSAPTAMGTIYANTPGTDRAGVGSFSYSLTRWSSEYYIAVPVGKTREQDIPRTIPGIQAPSDLWSMCEEEVRHYFERLASLVQIDIDSRPELSDILRASLCYMQMHVKDGKFIGGPRVYDESWWIRDGGCVAKAMLRLGNPQPVLDFLDSIVALQKENGDIPCGEGPAVYPGIIQHDRFGQFIHLVAETYRLTRDIGVLRRYFECANKVARYAEALRQSTRIDHYRGTVLFGVLPPNASHEGYGLESQVVTLWDNMWWLLGCKEMGYMSRELGNTELANEYDHLVTEVRRELYQAIELSMKKFDLDFIPAALDRGDQDFPGVCTLAGLCEELPFMPPALRDAFWQAGRYHYEYFRTRLPSGRRPTYGLFEFRIVDALIRSGKWQEAHERLEYYLADLRPREFLCWADQTWPDDENHYRGDMPHPWIHAEFVHAFRSFLAYENRNENALIIGAGLILEWLSGKGVRIVGLPTAWGSLSYRAYEKNGALTVEISGDLTLPPGGIILSFPGYQELVAVSVPVTHVLKKHA
jgi:hypothetical protein